MPHNTTTAQHILSSAKIGQQQLRITGSIQELHDRQNIGIDIRKFYLSNGEWKPTKKGIWLDLDQLKCLIGMLISESEAIPHITSDLPSDEPTDRYINKSIRNFLAPDGEDIQKLS